MGIEPTYSAWKAAALPLSYTREPKQGLSKLFCAALSKASRILPMGSLLVPDTLLRSNRNTFRKIVPIFRR